MLNNTQSLYDYLGRAAGPTLGLEVAKYARQQNSPVQTREISNPKYSGLVNLYTENLLMAFFNNPNYRDIINTDKIQYELKSKKSLERKISESQDNTLPF
jgi:hypothetical protein